MVVLLATTIIHCSDAVSIISKVTKVVGLTSQQQIEIIRTIRQSIPSCPLIIKPNDRPKSSP